MKDARARNPLYRGIEEETREAGTIQRVRLRGRQEIINGIS